MLKLANINNKILRRCIEMKKEKIQVIASKGLCNIASLNIYKIENGIDDYVIAGVNNLNVRKYKLYNSTKGTYFNFGGTRNYLNEFIRL